MRAPIAILLSCLLAACNAQETAAPAPAVLPLAAAAPAPPGPCKLGAEDLRAARDAREIERLFRQVLNCRQSAAASVKGRYGSRRMALPEAATALIGLRAATRHDIDYVRGRITRAAPEDRRRIGALLDEAEADLLRFNLQAG